MSFPRHPEIYPSDEGANIVGALAHRLDEFPVGYSLAGCAPALLASASPTVSEYAVTSFRRSMIFHRPVNCALTVCLTPRGRFSGMQGSDYRKCGLPCWCTLPHGTNLRGAWPGLCPSGPR